MCSLIETLHVFPISYAFVNLFASGGPGPSETFLDQAEKSKMLRDRGNKSYSRKEMHAALAFYSQAIVAAPINSRETALAIGMSIL